MADTKLSDLTELAATPASDDEVYIRDVSEAAAAESKRITIANLLAAAAGVVSGLIVMWHGTIANIPSGWVICDGDNSTPNLLGKFVEGVATAGTNPGATGGATGKSTSGHYHGIPMGKGISALDVGDTYGSDPETSYATQRAEATAQTLSSVVRSSTKTDTISDIRPKFYDVAFIMKT